MQQIFISPILDDGPPEHNYRCKAVDQVVGNYQQIIPSNVTTGVPLFSWGLVAVSTTDVTVAVADPANLAVPQASLDNKWSTVPAGLRNATQNKMQNLGIGTGFIGANTSVRDIINAIGHKLEATFDANRFWAP